MEQKLLAIKANRSANSNKGIGAVTIDRRGDEEIVLRFLGKRLAWGQSARQVRLDMGLAEELCRLLNDELDCMPEPGVVLPPVTGHGV
jgi:hypothetical protein